MAQEFVNYKKKLISSTPDDLKIKGNSCKTREEKWLKDTTILIERAQGAIKENK